MGKKLLITLAVERKFASEGLIASDSDDDMLTAMARELVENKGYWGVCGQCVARARSIAALNVSSGRSRTGGVVDCADLPLLILRYLLGLVHHAGWNNDAEFTCFALRSSIPEQRFYIYLQRHLARDATEDAGSCGQCRYGLLRNPVDI
jgi:hypothetical protein